MENKVPYWQSTKCPLSKRGVPPKYVKMTKDEVSGVIEMHNSGINNADIARRFSRHPSSIGDLLNSRGYKAKSHSELQRKYSIDECFFDNIDTEEKAYLLGFLFADGYMNKSNNCIKICLSAYDEEILILFSSLLKSNRPLVKYKGVTALGKIRDYIRMDVSNKKLFENLIKHGCTPRKSESIRFPYWLEKQLRRHFIRGYFDGDGGFTINKKIPSNVTFGFTSNKIFLQEVMNIICGEVGLNQIKINDAFNANPCYGNFRYGGRGNCKKFCDWIYRDSKIFLKRKYNQYRLICGEMSS